MASHPSLPQLPQLPPLDLQSAEEGSSRPFEDSFSSAFHSIQPGPPSLQSRESLTPPPPLRKSLSVDSFVTSPILATPRQQKDSQPSASRGFVAGLTSAFRRESATDLRSGRNRGASVSSVREQQQQQQRESDVDRHPFPDRDQRFRRPSLKGADPPRIPVRGGELPLPSRTPTSANDTHVPLSPTSTSEQLGYFAHVSSAHQSAPRRLGTAAANSGRARSMSNGSQSQPQPRRMLINTQLSNAPPPPLPTMNENVTLVVIGALGCGKTQAIRRGLSGFHLSEALPSTVQKVIGDSSVPLYTYRLGTIVRDKFPDCPLTVIEIDATVTNGHISRDHLWPEAIPCIDGAVICYDSSDSDSFRPVEPILRAYHAMRLPMIGLACKTDLERQIDPASVSDLLNGYRAGLIEATIHSDTGRSKLKRSFDWVLKAVFRHRQAIDTINLPDHIYLNPASPDVLASPPLWESSRTATPTVTQPHPPPSGPLPTPPLHNHHSPSHISYLNSSDKPTAANTLPSAALDKVQEDGGPPPETRATSEYTDVIENDAQQYLNGLDGEPTNLALVDTHQAPGKEKDKPKPAQFATLDTLLDKLLFIAVSGDDPSFISSFLLTYRRFCTPRSVLLAMQKKMRQLDEPSGDPMFSCFAQMRICHLLEVWISDYPTDFAVKGTAGALSALMRSILTKTHLLHYGSQLLPFLEVLPTLQDQDSTWATQPEATEESDGESLLDDEEYIKPDDDDDDDDDDLSPHSLSKDAYTPLSPPPTASSMTAQSSANSRERKPSLPLVKTLGLALNGSSDHPESSSKQQLKELSRIANEIMNIDASEIAEEITRVEAKYFLEITNRDWMHFVFLKQKKPGDPIVAFNTIANHIGDWVISLILCHDKPQRRARQMEKMVDIAARLRTLNNYSALRAFVAGINSATYPGDETLDLFKSRSPEQAKNLQSWEVLLQQLRAHRAYRLALRNSKGSCIPAMEVHIADMVKTQENNRDHKEDDPQRIHWAKFSMMGRFVSVTTQCQNQCRSSTEYNFPDRRNIRDLFFKRTVMSLDLQRARLKDPEIGEYGVPPSQIIPKQDTRSRFLPW